MGRMLNGYMLSGFNTWFEYARSVRDYENGLKKAIGMFRNRHLSRSWRTWYDKVRMLIRHRNITTKFLLKLSQRMEQAAFNGWLGSRFLTLILVCHG